MKFSRRDFLKSAGVMTLAVAATAALAGCSDSTTKKVAVTITAEDPWSAYSVNTTITVLATADVVENSTVADLVPAGFKLGETSNYPITNTDKGSSISATMKLDTNEKQKVTIEYKVEGAADAVKTVYVIADKTATQLPASTITSNLPTDYTRADSTTLAYTISGGTITVIVEKKAS